MKTWLWLGAVMGFMTALAVSGCRGGGASGGPDALDGQADVLSPDGSRHDASSLDESAWLPDDLPLFNTDIGRFVGYPSFCMSKCTTQALPDWCDDVWNCATEFYNGVCGLDEAKRLLEEGLCPPRDRSVIREGERLILGGDPAHKTTLPHGAQCPEGFERLPQDWKPDPASWFQPTCWDVGYATRIPEPASLDGQYILSGLDAFYLADPGAIWAQSLLWVSAGGYQNGPPWIAAPWPDGALLAYPPPAIEDGKMKVCAAKDAPWVDMDKREVVAQYGEFFTRVVIRKFETASGCIIPWLDVLTYCCGPILMLWPEEITELRASLDEQCRAARDYLIKKAENSPFEQDKLLVDDFAFEVVAPRARGLQWMGLRPVEWQPEGRPDVRRVHFEPELLSCAEAPACQVGLGRVYLHHYYPECDKVLYDGKDEEDYDALRRCLLATLCGRYNVSSMKLELDSAGYPSVITKMSYTWCLRDQVQEGQDWYYPCEPMVFTSPYRTPDEVAKDIPPP